MKKYEILEHTSDLKIKVFGNTEKDLFENAMLAMFEGAKYQAVDKGKRIKNEIKISSFDLPSLLVDFLNEILYLVETKKRVYQKIIFKKFSKKEMEADLIGKKLKRMGVHIKGVTYYGLDVFQNEEGKWEATILFDI